MPARRPSRPIPRKTVDEVHVPAPVGGLNRIDPIGKMDLGDAVLLYNLVAAEFGLRSRLGYHEWVTNLIGTFDNTVRSVLPFKGSKSNGSTDKLFACTDNGIWDVSASTQAPTAPAGVTAFATVGPDSGWGQSLVAVDANGNHNLLYFDESNGYYLYREATNDWIKVTQGAGANQIAAPADPTQFVQACVHGNRVWFVPKDSTKAYYTAPAIGSGAIFGAVTAFDFGPLFRSGGALVGLYKWTRDGGGGMQTALVAISSGGDVVVFDGSDPSAFSTWSLTGVWSVGGVPAGRRVATEFGGDLLILSTFGAIPLSRLVNGVSIVDRTQYATAKIVNLINALMYSASGLKGWSLRLHPQDNVLLITVPTASGQATVQLAMSIANRSWSQYRGLPMLSNEVWNGQMYFGTADGRVCVHTDYVDGVQLANVSAYTPIDCSLLAAYQNLGTGRQKRVQLVRPKFLAQGVAPHFNCGARFNYDLSEMSQPGPPGASTGAVWDSAVWDSSLWQGDYVAQSSLSAAPGVGVDVALGIRFQAVSRTVLAGFDVAFEEGGML